MEMMTAAQHKASRGPRTFPRDNQTEAGGARAACGWWREGDDATSNEDVSRGAALTSASGNTAVVGGLNAGLAPQDRMQGAQS